MELPNWVRICWWVVLTLSLGTFMWQRRADLLGGKPTPFDALVFVIWACLLLAPIFTEVTMLGVKLKQQVEAVKAHVERVDTQVEGLRAELHNSVEVRSQFNPQINFGTPPPDSELPALEQKVRGIVEVFLRSSGLERAGTGRPVAFEVPENNAYLFSVRFTMEAELRRIMTELGQPEDQRRPTPIPSMVRTLVELQTITPNLGRVTQEVYAVCSPAIHGEPVSDAQSQFVREVAPDLISALKGIRVVTT